MITVTTLSVILENFLSKLGKNYRNLSEIQVLKSLLKRMWYGCKIEEKCQKDQFVVGKIRHRHFISA